MKKYSFSFLFIAILLVQPTYAQVIELRAKQRNDQKIGLDWFFKGENVSTSLERRENTDGDRFYVNGDKTTHKGLELSLSSKLSSQFTTKLAYSYSKHEYDNDAVYGNNEQAAAPNHVSNARLIYKPKQVEGLTAMLEMEHVGSYWLDDNNTKKYGGYEVGNLKVSYKPNKKVNLFTKVNNITDKTYAETGSISYGKEKYTPAAPRQFFVGFEYNW